MTIAIKDRGADKGLVCWMQILFLAENSLEFSAFLLCLDLF